MTPGDLEHYNTCATVPFSPNLYRFTVLSAVFKHKAILREVHQIIPQNDLEHYKVKTTQYVLLVPSSQNFSQFRSTSNYISSYRPILEKCTE